MEKTTTTTTKKLTLEAGANSSTNKIKNQNGIMCRIDGRNANLLNVKKSTGLWATQTNQILSARFPPPLPSKSSSSLNRQNQNSCFQNQPSIEMMDKGGGADRQK